MGSLQKSVKQVTCTHRMEGGDRSRRPSRISQIVAPIVKIGRKLSRKENVEKESEEEEEDDYTSTYQEVMKAGVKIPVDFISEMIEAFRLFDKVLGPLMRTLGKNPTEAEIYNMMAEVDVDHNGKLDLREFILMMYNMLGNKDNMEEMKMAFRAFDTDGDGKVSKDELRISMMNLGQRFTEEDIDDIIAKYDADGDASLQFDEFCNMFSNDVCKL